MKKAAVIIVGLVILGVLAIFSMTFTVSFNQVAVQSRFGKVDESSIIRTPGLHFRLPFFADSVHLFDTRLQILESPLENIQTADGQQIVVRGFLLWRVDKEGTGPLSFYQSFPDLAAARDALRTQFRDAMTSLSEYKFDELLGENSRLTHAEDSILKRMSASVSEGIDPVTVGVSRIAFKESTTSEVVRRMQARRDTLADSERARGSAEAERIRSHASGVAEKILAFAAQRAQEIRTEGEELGAHYLSEMGEDEQLAIFLLWIDALERSLSDNTTYVIDTAVAPWHLLESDGSPGVLPVVSGTEQDQ
ncbi:MAG: SPFH domain-containing protein [Phycisphaerales bacterium]|jgi:membrane protease subunit HflC|nr:SPFH domain-containing protein [Phycisphaerales bacterium]